MFLRDLATYGCLQIKDALTVRAPRTLSREPVKERYNNLLLQIYRERELSYYLLQSN